MAKIRKDKIVTEKARKAIEKIWNKAELKGRPWSKMSTKSPFVGTNILVASGDELVSISYDYENDSLLIHEYQKSKTQLGEEIRASLEKEKLRYSR
jgi:hypothetical protein